MHGKLKQSVHDKHNCPNYVSINYNYLENQFFSNMFKLFFVCILCLVVLALCTSLPHRWYHQNKWGIAITRSYLSDLGKMRSVAFWTCPNRKENMLSLIISLKTVYKNFAFHQNIILLTIKFYFRSSAVFGYPFHIGVQKRKRIEWYNLNQHDIRDWDIQNYMLIAFQYIIAI